MASFDAATSTIPLKEKIRRKAAIGGDVGYCGLRVFGIQECRY